MKLTLLHFAGLGSLICLGCNVRPADPGSDEIGTDTTSESESGSDGETSTDTQSETQTDDEEDPDGVTDLDIPSGPECAWDLPPDTACLGNAGFLYTAIPPTSVLAGDVDGDGIVDVIASGLSANLLQVALGQGNGEFSDSWIGSALAQGTRGLAFGDIDGDGFGDLVLANIFAPAGTGVAYGDGTGKFSPPLFKMTGMTPRAVALGHVDSDEWLDALVADEASAQVFLLSGNGVDFDLDGTLAVGNEPYDVVVADIDADGSLDVATANRADNSVSVLWGDGQGGFSDQQVLPVGAGPRALVAVDLEHDGGGLDLVTADFDGNTASLLRYRDELEPRGFDPFDAIPVGAQPYAIAAGDIEADGSSEVFTADSGDGTVSVLRNFGGELSPGYGLVTVGSQPFDIVVAQLDGDGDDQSYLDVLTADFGSLTISILLTGW